MPCKVMNKIIQSQLVKGIFWANLIDMYSESKHWILEGYVNNFQKKIEFITRSTFKTI